MYYISYEYRMAVRKIAKWQWAVGHSTINIIHYDNSRLVTATSSRPRELGMNLGMIEKL